MIKEYIRESALSLGIKKIGFTKNSVVALFPYFVAGEEGNLSLYARSMDYHIIAEQKLKMLSQTLRQNGASEVTIHVDKGKYNDRKAAYDAGLGFYGLNGMLICKEYGSYFFIGQIICDLEFESDRPMDMDCLLCGRCQRACPANAIMGGKVDAEKCLSNITQVRRVLSQEEEQLIKSQNTCWGCDVCQKVCPHNAGLKTTAIPEFLESRIKNLRLSDIEPLSGKAFKEKYKNYAFSWRGKGVLVRNLKIWEKSNEEK